MFKTGDRVQGVGEYFETRARVRNPTGVVDQRGADSFYVYVTWDHDGHQSGERPEFLRLLPETESGTNPKDLIGETKPQLHLVPAAALIRLAKVMELGATKYGAYNWRKNKVRLTVYLSAAMRHLVSCLDGEDVDPESGQTHLAHAMACFAIVIDAMETGNLVDDRPPAGPAAALIKELTT